PVMRLFISVAYRISWTSGIHQFIRSAFDRLGDQMRRAIVLAVTMILALGESAYGSDCNSHQQVTHRSAEQLFKMDSGKETILWDASHYCSDALKLAEKTGKDVTSLRQNTMRYLLTCVDNDMTSPESVVDPWKQEALSDSAIMSV